MSVKNGEKQILIHVSVLPLSIAVVLQKVSRQMLRTVHLLRDTSVIDVAKKVLCIMLHVFQALLMLKDRALDSGLPDKR